MRGHVAPAMPAAISVTPRGDTASGDGYRTVRSNSICRTISAMARAFAIALLCAGCRQLLGLGEPTPASVGDAAPQDGAERDTVMVQVDAPPGCFGSGIWIVCLSAAADVTVMGAIDTNANTLCAASQPPGWLANGQPAA